MGRRRQSFQVSILGAALALGAHAGVAAQTVEHRLGVGRFASVTFADTAAQDVLAGMGQLLQDDDDGAGPNDVECDVSFELDQPVGEFTAEEAPGTISIEADMFAVMDAHEASDVKVVEAIEWCGHVEGPIDGTYWGCSDGTSFAVIAGLPLKTAVVAWTHEFGHTRVGLGPSYHVNQPRMVMHKRGHPDNRQVSWSECQSFREP